MLREAVAQTPLVEAKRYMDRARSSRRGGGRAAANVALRSGRGLSLVRFPRTIAQARRCALLKDFGVTPRCGPVLRLSEPSCCAGHRASRMRVCGHTSMTSSPAKRAGSVTMRRRALSAGGRRRSDRSQPLEVIGSRRSPLLDYYRPGLALHVSGEGSSRRSAPRSGPPWEPRVIVAQSRREIALIAPAARCWPGRGAAPHVRAARGCRPSRSTRSRGVHPRAAARPPRSGIAASRRRRASRSTKRSCTASRARRKIREGESSGWTSVDPRRTRWRASSLA